MEATRFKKGLTSGYSRAYEREALWFVEKVGDIMLTELSHPSPLHEPAIFSNVFPLI